MWSCLSVNYTAGTPQMLHGYLKSHGHCINMEIDICNCISACTNIQILLLGRDATIYRYIMYRIALSLYRCIDTKSNRIDISHIVMYRRNVACFNEIIIHCDQPKWYMMLLKEKKSFISLKSNTEQCFDSTLYQTIYHYIMIHQRQCIDTSTHCIVATLLLGGLIPDTISPGPHSSKAWID